MLSSYSSSFCSSIYPIVVNIISAISFVSEFCCLSSFLESVALEYLNIEGVLERFIKLFSLIWMAASMLSLPPSSED